MIKIDFYKDGFEVTGHDIEKICWVVSYATWVKYLYVSDVTEDYIYFESGSLEETKNDGLTYFKSSHSEAIHQIECLKYEMEDWNKHVAQNRLDINYIDDYYKIKYDYHTKL